MDQLSNPNGYSVSACEPSEITKEDLVACLAVIKSGDAVNPESAEKELPLSGTLAIVRKDNRIVGVGAIKRIRRGYAAMVAERSGKEFSSGTPELGYIAVDREHQGHHLSYRIVTALLSENDGATFATTSNPRMKATLGKAGFVQEGEEWDGHSGRLSLWIKK